MSNVRVIRRSQARHAVAAFVSRCPPVEPLDAWADQLLEIVESATFATPVKGPKTLMEVFAEEDWLPGGQ